MMKAVWSGITAAALLLGCASTALAQNDSATVTVTANVNARAKLTVSRANVVFGDADPDNTPLLSAAALDITVKGRTTAGGTLDLSVVADGDLTTGTDTIDISNLKWTATGTGFVPGTANIAEQSVGTWTGSGNVSGTQTYTLVNSWDYATGAYTVTMTYTLSAS